MRKNDIVKIDHHPKVDTFGKIELIKVLENNIKNNVYDKISTQKIIGFVNSFVNGPVEYDDKNNVILSANMGAVKMLEKAASAKPIIPIKLAISAFSSPRIRGFEIFSGSEDITTSVFSSCSRCIFSA